MLFVPGIEVVLIPSTSSLVRAGANLGQQLIALAVLGNGDTTGIEEGLEARVGPSLDRGIELILSLQLDVIGSFGKFVASPGSSGAKGISSGGRDTSCFIDEIGAVLAGKSNEFIALRALGDLDIVFIKELLQPGVRPGIEQLLAQRGLGSFSRRDCRRSEVAGLQASQTGVAADRGNESITVGGLGNRPSALIEPFLEIGLGPLLVQPVTGIGCGLANLVRNGFIVLAGGLDQDVALARLRCGNAVAIEECLQLGVRPAITGSAMIR